MIYLNSLPEGTFFNIVGFGDKFEKLFPESKEYNEHTLGEASTHVEISHFVTWYRLRISKQIWEEQIL